MVYHFGFVVVASSFFLFFFFSFEWNFYRSSVQSSWFVVDSFWNNFWLVTRNFVWIFRINDRCVEYIYISIIDVDESSDAEFWLNYRVIDIGLGESIFFFFFFYLNAFRIIESSNRWPISLNATVWCVHETSRDESKKARWFRHAWISKSDSIVPRRVTLRLSLSRIINLTDCWNSISFNPLVHRFILKKEASTLFRSFISIPPLSIKYFFDSSRKLVDALARARLRIRSNEIQIINYLPKRKR